MITLYSLGFVVEMLLSFGHSMTVHVSRHSQHKKWDDIFLCLDLDDEKEFGFR